MKYCFRYNITVEDFAEYNAYTAWSAPWLKKYRLIYAGRTLLYSTISFTACMIIFRKIYPPRKDNYPVLLIISLLFLLVLLYIFYYQAPFSVKNKAKNLIIKDENIHILNETEVEFNEDGFTSTDKQSSNHQKWSSVIRYAVTKDYFYIYLNMMQAQIIPKRLFTSQKDIEEFDRFLTHKIPISASFRSLDI